MNPDFRNVYSDDARAESYAGLEYPGTYYLAFRDLPAVIERHVSGRVALDFGCGTGRSSRFMQGLGFSVVGLDISAPMLARARALSPEGDYRLVPDGDLSDLTGAQFDLILSTFTFDNIPSPENRLRLFTDLGHLLSQQGRLINLVSSPDIYVNEWASFSTRDFPENTSAGSGDSVRIEMLDVEDRRPVEDVMWTDSDYRSLYAAAGLEVLETHRPLGRSSDPRTWVSETRISPWVIYVLGQAC